MSGRPGPCRPSARQGADVDIDHTRRRTDTTAGTDRAATGTQEGTVAVPPLSTKSAVMSVKTALGYVCLVNAARKLTPYRRLKIDPLSGVRLVV
jgi:hypothetical protein